MILVPLLVFRAESATAGNVLVFFEDLTGLKSVSANVRLCPSSAGGKTGLYFVVLIRFFLQVHK